MNRDLLRLRANRSRVIQHSTSNTQHRTFGFQQGSAALTEPSIENTDNLPPEPSHPDPVPTRTNVVAGNPDGSAIWRDADYFHAWPRRDEDRSRRAAGGERCARKQHNCDDFLHDLLLPFDC
jgi:hypothetical protein